MPKLAGHSLNGQALSSKPRFSTKQLTKSSLANDPHLIETIAKDIADMGLVGEENAGLLTYLVATSRKLPEPLRLIIRGESSTGKSQIPKTIMPLIPPEDAIEATNITPNALYYEAEDALQHKAIFAGERMHRTDESAADAIAALRQLISEGRITKRVTVRDGQDFKTDHITREGPVAYIETTTAKVIFAEDLNRCISIWTDESERQTEAVMLATAKRYAAATKINRQEIIARHHEFQNELKRATVVIPFAEKLAKQMPAGRLEARRVIVQVLSTIEVVTLMHQFQRARDDERRLIATLDDYDIARRLLLEPLTESMAFDATSEKLVKKLKPRFPDKFTTNQVLKDFSDKMDASRKLNKLVRLGILKVLVKGRSHTPTTWAWTGRELDQVLPAVEAVS